MRIHFTLALVLSIAVSAFAQDGGEWYLGKPIKAITFEGLKNVEESELDGIVAPFIGQRFNEALFWDLQEKLYSLELFDLISPSAVPADAEKSIVMLHLVVVEKPIVSMIQFDGNSGIRTSELRDLISIKIFDVANSMRLQLDEQAIREKYLEKGYPDAKVKAETSIEDKTKLVVTFHIIEGEQIAIEAFRFEGNTTISEGSLKGLLSLKVKSILNDGAFQEAKLLSDSKTIMAYYQERGYVDAVVVDVSRELRKDEKNRNLLTITFKIKEGRQYSFGGISFQGNSIFKTEQLLELVYLKPGQILNFNRLESDFQRVADKYYDEGYIFNTITRTEQRNEDSGSIHYIISIVERDRAHIEDIIIKGNEKTKDWVILREIPLQTGDIFSKAKVISGLRNLYSLQYFSEISPETPQGSAENLMNLVFDVVEQSTADIQFGVTFAGLTSADSFPITGLIKWSERNFLGNGQTIGVELSAAPDAQKLSLQFSERWLFGMPLSGGFDFSINHSQSDTAQDSSGPIFNGDEDEAFPDPFLSWAEYIAASKVVPDAYLMKYDLWSFSLGFSSGYRFYLPIGTLSLGGGLSSGLIKNSYDAALYRPFDPTLRKGNNQWLLSNSIFSNIALDTRDIYYDPSSGYLASQKFSTIGLMPFEKEHYIRTDTKAEFFATLFSIPVTDTYKFSAILGTHSGLSLIFPQFVGEADIETSNKLALDGMFTARGWNSERANYGMALWENWVEIRNPIVPGVLALDWFFDAATVKAKPAELFTGLTLDDFRFSFGAGIRFAIAQFPFRFSLAKRFQFINGQFKWMTGDLWRGESDDSGLDFVLSFVMPSS